jgi:uncharacterized protein DUF6209
MTTAMSLDYSAAPGETAANVAILRFRRDQQSSGVSRHGRVRPGGRVRIEYDPARLIDGPPAAAAEIICHIRCSPSGAELGGSLQASVLTNQGSMPRLAWLEAQLPSDTTRIEVWFERRGPTGTTGWDSRYGQNYTFALASEGLPVPEPAVSLRPDAVVDANRIRVVDDTASKGTGGSAVHTGLTIRAQVATRPAPVSVWADVHVFDGTDQLIHTGTLVLQPPEARPEGTAEQTWKTEVYQGSGGGSGLGVWSRPDAHTVQYRLYCESSEGAFTDGVMHEFDVPPDAEVRPIPGGW